MRAGDGRSWKLSETLASEIADLVIREFRAQAVAVEVRKFVITQARYVAVRLTKP